MWVWDRSATTSAARPVPAAATGVALNATLSPDGSLLVVPYLDYGRAVTELVVFDAATISVIDRLASPRGPVVAVSPDNRMIGDLRHLLSPLAETLPARSGRPASERASSKISTQSPRTSIR